MLMQGTWIDGQRLGEVLHGAVGLRQLLVHLDQ
jgi:hypothetical protein